jgi:hypothetical protein
MVYPAGGQMDEGISLATAMSVARRFRGAFFIAEGTPSSFMKRDYYINVQHWLEYEIQI